MIGPCLLVASLLLFINGNLVSIMISMAMFGLVNMMIMSSAMAISACLVEPSNRGKVRGGLNFVGYILIGIGMLLGNFFYNVLPQLPFYLTIGLAIPMMIIAYFRVPEPKKEERKF